MTHATKPRNERARGTTDENIVALVESARRFVHAADEFMPECREAVGEYLSELIDDVDHLGDALEASEHAITATEMSDQQRKEDALQILKTAIQQIETLRCAANVSGYPKDGDTELFHFYDVELSPAK